MMDDSIVTVTTRTCIYPVAQEMATKEHPIVTLKGEKRASGLFTILTCRGCKKELLLPTRKDETMKNGLYYFDIRVVCGTLASGGTSDQIEQYKGYHDTEGDNVHLIGGDNW